MGRSAIDGEAKDLRDAVNDWQLDIFKMELAILTLKIYSHTWFAPFFCKVGIKKKITVPPSPGATPTCLEPEIIHQSYRIWELHTLRFLVMQLTVLCHLSSVLTQHTRYEFILEMIIRKDQYQRQPGSLNKILFR